jgi:hypothetical protein
MEVPLKHRKKKNQRPHFMWFHRNHHASFSFFYLLIFKILDHDKRCNPVKHTIEDRKLNSDDSNTANLKAVGRHLSKGYKAITLIPMCIFLANSRLHILS